MVDNTWSEINQTAKPISKKLASLLTEEPQEPKAPKKSKPEPPFFKAFQQGLLTIKEHTLLRDYCSRIGEDVYWSWKFSGFAQGHPYLKITAAYPEPTAEEEKLLVFLAQQDDREAQEILTGFLLRYVIKGAVSFVYFKTANKWLSSGLQEEDFEEFIGLGHLKVAEIVCKNIKNFFGGSRLATYVVRAITKGIIGRIRQQAQREQILKKAEAQEKLFKSGTIEPERFEQLKKILFKEEQVTSKELVCTMDDEIALIELEGLLTWAIAAYLTLGRKDGQQQKNNAVVLRLLGWTYLDIRKAVRDSSWSDDEGARSCVRRAVDQGGLGDMPPADEIHELLSQHYFESGQLEETLAGLLQGTDLDGCIANLSLSSLRG